VRVNVAVDVRLANREPDSKIVTDPEHTTVGVLRKERTRHLFERIGCRGRQTIPQNEHHQLTQTPTSIPNANHARLADISMINIH